MAQRNRRRARGGGGANPKRDPSASGVPTPGPFESGEERLTEAQLAFGRPDAAETPNEQELAAFEEADAGHPAADAAHPAPGTGGVATPGAGTFATPANGAPAVPAGGALVGPAGEGAAARGHAVAERKPGLVGQMVGFLQGSWRELQRVQWPDRRQVFQATGVVLGFVIVAGAFLGVSSWAAQKIVNLILYGHG